MTDKPRILKCETNGCPNGAYFCTFEDEYVCKYCADRFTSSNDEYSSDEDRSDDHTIISCVSCKIENVEFWRASKILYHNCNSIYPTFVEYEQCCECIYCLDCANIQESLRDDLKRCAYCDCYCGNLPVENFCFKPAK